MQQKRILWWIVLTRLVPGHYVSSVVIFVYWSVAHRHPRQIHYLLNVY